MAAFPKFADDDERPLEETLSEVLRDAARPLDAAPAPAELDDSFPAPDPEVSERSESPTADVLAMTRSPLVSYPDEPARVSGIEEIAAQVREDGPALAMPVADDAGPTTAATAERRGTTGRALLVAACFAASFAAAFVGLRAVLVGTRAPAPSPESVRSERRARPNSSAPALARSATADVETAPAAAPSESAALPDPSASPAPSLSAAPAREVRPAPLVPAGSRPAVAPEPIQPPARPLEPPRGSGHSPSESAPAPAGAPSPNDDPYG